jgi:hypothetical protein
MHKGHWALVLAVCLSIAAVLGVRQQRKVERILSDKITVKAPELGKGIHLLIPDLKNAKVYAPDRPHDPFELSGEDRFERVKRLRHFTVNTNKYGFRGGPLREPKESIRILCLGDSVTFGWGVSDTESYPYLLGESTGLDVVNAGVPAMKPMAISRWLGAQKAKVFQADIVLIALRPDQSTSNPLRDFERSIRQAQKAVEPARFGLILPPVSSFDPRGMGALPNEITFIQRRLKDIPQLELTEPFHQQMPDTGVTLRQKNGVQQMLSRKDGSVIVEGVQPEQGPGRPSIAPEIIARFEADTEIKEPLFFDGGHPDEEGLQIFASEVGKWLRQLGWI